MKTVRSHKDLEVWRKSMSLVELCYKATASFPSREQFGLTYQIRKSAVSIPSNIAEGHCRPSRQAFLYHLGIALGSQAELETQVELAMRLGLLSVPDVASIVDLTAQVGRQLHGLSRALARKSASL